MFQPHVPGLYRASSSGERTTQGSASTIHDVAKAGRWLTVGSDSAWVEPMDLPDMPGSALVYVPSLQWLYAHAAASPVVRDVVMARAKARGWTVAWLGTARDVQAKVGG